LPRENYTPRPGEGIKGEEYEFCRGCHLSVCYLVRKSTLF
jgi:hypothetical protein